MKRWIAGVLAVVSGVFLVGCWPREGGGDSPCPCPGGGGTTAILVPWETIEQGTHSGIKEERGVVIREAQAWRNFWEEHVAGRYPKPELPFVDFVREMVIGYFLGERPTGGYVVEVEEIWVMEGKVSVRVGVRSPPPGDPVIQVLTQPCHLVRLGRFDLPVDFIVLEAESLLQGK